MTKSAPASEVRLPKVSGELFSLTYGALVSQIVKDYQNVEDVNKQLSRRATSDDRNTPTQLALHHSQSGRGGGSGGPGGRAAPEPWARAPQGQGQGPQGLSWAAPRPCAAASGLAPLPPALRRCLRPRCAGSRAPCLARLVQAESSSLFVAFNVLFVLACTREK